MKKVLITGVNGFCGKHLVQRLVREGVTQIYGADITPLSDMPIGLTGYHHVDITNEVHVSDILQTIQPDAIFHLAGINQGSPQKIYSVNVLGSINILENVRQFSPHAGVLMAGSAAEYGSIPEDVMPLTEEQICMPSGHYGISKYAATLIALDYVRVYGLKINIVRPFNIVGAGVPSSLVIGAILERIRDALKQAHEKPDIRVGNLDTQRDFIAIDDVVDAYIELMQSECAGEIFNICSGEPRSIRSVLATLLSNSEKSVELKIAPELIRSTDVLTSYGSFAKARKAFGFRPQRTLDDALKNAWDHAMGVRS